MMKSTRVSKKRVQAVAEGYRSDLERRYHALHPELLYETQSFPYEVVETRSYTPDFITPDGACWHETKGRFTSDDRKKMLLVKEQYPHVKITLIFQNPNLKLTKAVGSQTYRQWAEKHGFIVKRVGEI